MLKALIFALLVAHVAYGQLVPFVTSWQQAQDDPKYALADLAIGLYNSAQTEYVAIGGVNNTANGQGWTYSNGTMVPYSTNDTFNYPDHVYLFKAYRDENNAPGMLITTWYPSVLDTLGYAGATATPVGGKLLVIGGTQTVNGTTTFVNNARTFSFTVITDENNPDNNNVTYTANAVAAPTSLPAFHTAVLFGSTVVVFGGIVNTDNGTIYSNNVAYYVSVNGTYQWQYPNVTGSISGRAGHIAVQYNTSHMLVYGGYDDVTTYTDLWFYNYNSKTWTSVNTTVATIPSSSVTGLYGSNPPPGQIANNLFTPTIRERSGAQGQLLTADTSSNRYLVIFGGKTDNGTVLDELLTLDVQSWKWYIIPISRTGPSARYRHATYQVDAKTMIVWGGVNSTDNVQGSIYSLAITLSAPPAPDDGPMGSSAIVLTVSALSAVLLALLALVF